MLDASSPAGPPFPAGDGGDPLIGRTLGGHYRVEALIGRGAMGVVYRARHTLLDQDFAVKVLAEGVGADAEVRRRFLLEAKSLTFFTHKHAVQVRHCGEEGGLLYLAMDLVPGETLAALLERERPLPEARAAGIALQVLDALDEAHRAGIVHRDLKPGNVMVETARGDGAPARDRVRVLDFGLARIVDAERAALPGAFASTGGNVVGTVAYMSPEQLRAEEGVDGRSDLFSVGVVLYEMLTGRLPFEGKSTMSIALGILERDPRPLKEAAAPAVSDAMGMVLARALAKSPARRFATAAEFADAIRGALAGTEPPPPPPSAAEAPPAPARRRRAPAAALAVLLLALGVAAFLALNGGAGAGDRAAGEAALLDGRFAEAAEAYGRLVTAGRATPEDHLHRAEARVELLEPEAASDLDAARAGLPQDPRVPLLEGRFAWRVRQPRDAARAEQALIQALTWDKGFLEARVERVRQRLQAGLTNDALGDIQILERDKSAPRALALTLRSQYETTRLGLKEVPLTTQSIEAAVALAEDGAKADLRDAEASDQLTNVLVYLALFARSAGAHELARKSLDRAEAAASEAIRRALLDRGYRRQGRWIGRYYIGRAMARSQADDFSGAKADYDEVLKRNPHDPEARGHVVYATRFVEPEKAIRDAQALYDATGKTEFLFDAAFGRQTIGLEKAAIGDVEGAAEDFRLAIEKYGEGVRLAPPDYAAFTTYRGEARVLRARLTTGRAREDDLDAALADFRASVKGFPGDSEVFLRRAAVYTLRGDTAKALEDMEKAVGDDRGKTPRYYQELARALLARADVDAAEGRREEAKARIARVLPTLEIALARMPEVRPRVLPLMATAEARAAPLAASPEEKAAHLARARALVDELTAAAAKAEGEDGTRLLAAAALANAEIALAAGDPARAAAAAKEAIGIRERENAAKRWSLDGAWVDRLALFLDAAGKPEEARAAREKAAGLPR